MPSSILLVTYGQINCDVLTEQLTDLLGDRVTVQGVCVGDRRMQEMMRAADLVIISSRSCLLRIGDQIDDMEKVLVARRSVDYAHMHLLLDLPSGTRAMLVNDNRTNSEEVIQLIYGLGFHHLSLEPVYPGGPIPQDIDIAITPGEPQFVPSGVSQIVDLGPRTIDVTTMIEILSRLGMLDEKANILTARSVQHLISITRRLNSSLREVNHLHRLLETTLHKAEDGIITVDALGRVVVFNYAAAQLFQLSSATLRGQTLAEFIPELKVSETLKSMEPEEDVASRLRGRDVFITRKPLMENGRVDGAVMVIREFRTIERHDEKLRTHLRQQGHVARYRFADCVAVSPAMRSVVERARTFTHTLSTVLIQGDTGTGKEMVAQAIHNGSPRSDRPFVAINCAALSDELLESELFGYVEGAFTGAKRGGRQGVFEQAHTGTIFLDEIGDIPLRVQARLLRVLEERQVMRVGGERLSPVDVRVMAATNRDLRQLVRAGTFRADLYYRLNVLNLYIPPLRERREDLIHLVDSFLPSHIGSHREFLTQGVLKIFMEYPWPGNARELRNVVEFLVHTVPAGGVMLEHLPADLLRDTGLPETETPLTQDERHLLSLLCDAERQGRRLGRRSLAVLMQQTGRPATEEVVRRLMTSLAAMELVEIGLGRNGTRVTQRGRNSLWPGLSSAPIDSVSWPGTIFRS